MTNLPVTVPQDLRDALAEACGELFAVSYLCGASVRNGWLRPRTRIACERLLENPKACYVLDKAGLHIGQTLSPDEREPIQAVTESLQRYERTGKF